MSRNGLIINLPSQTLLGRGGQTSRPGEGRGGQPDPASLPLPSAVLSKQLAMGMSLEAGHLGRMAAGQAGRGTWALSGAFPIPWPAIPPVLWFAVPLCRPRGSKPIFHPQGKNSRSNCLLPACRLF